MSPTFPTTPDLVPTSGWSAFADECKLLVFIDRCMGDISLATTLLASFHARLPKVAEQVESLIAAEDWPAALRAAHSLKGEAGSLAIGRLEHSALELEQCLRAMRYDDVPRCARALRAELDRSRDVLPMALEALSRLAPSNA